MTSVPTNNTYEFYVSFKKERVGSAIGELLGSKGVRAAILMDSAARDIFPDLRKAQTEEDFREVGKVLAARYETHFLLETLTVILGSLKNDYWRIRDAMPYVFDEILKASQ